MCDNDSLDDMHEYQSRTGELSRRKFGALTLGAGITLMLSRGAWAADLQETSVEIKTPAGVADAWFVHPASGAHPGVLIWPDIFGLRPAFKQMAKRLAGEGYSVLVVNPFYRIKKASDTEERPNMDDPESRKALFSLMGTLTPEVQLADAQAFVAFLDAQASVDKKRKIGTTGYCMGGPITMRTAATRPDRVGAGASFHGGGLVTDKPDSPHLLVPKMKARYLFAIAENDDKQAPQVKDELRKAFDAAKLPAEIEVYAGTMHGWCPPDSPVYNEAQAEKAWSRMLALFKTALA